MKTIREKLESFCHSYPATVAIVVVRNGGKLNAMAAAWHMPVSFKPPLYAVSISPKRYTHNLIVESKEFSLNFLSQEHVALIHRLGHVSGAKIDKFEKFSIKVEKPVKTKCPVLKDAFAAYECRLVDHKSSGDHTVFIGEIVAIHSEDENFAIDGLVRLDRTKPAMYLGDDHYVTADEKSAVSTKGTITE